MNSHRKIRLAATVGVAALWTSGALAQEATTAEPDTAPATETAATRRSATYLDLTASLGYSTNPRLSLADSPDAAFGRASARGVHTIASERTNGSITGFVEASSYFDKYGLESIFAVDGNISHAASETVTVFGSAGVSGDISAQLSNRFLYVPPLPEVPDPNLPPPVTVEDPDYFGFAGRQYRIYGQGGASIRASERGRISISAGSQRVFYTNELLNDYTSLFSTVSYNHMLSERTSVGASLGINRTDYSDSDDQSTIVTPSVFVSTQLAENWSAQASVGVAFSSVDRLGSKANSTNLSLDGSICRAGEYERLCGHSSRYSQASAREALVTSSSIGVEWYKKLDAEQTIQLSASAVRYEVDDVVQSNSRSHHFRIAASYDRRFNQRMSAGVDVGARSLRLQGPDPDADLNASVFIRYRLGDLG